MAFIVVLIVRRLMGQVIIQSHATFLIEYAPMVVALIGALVSLGFIIIFELVNTYNYDRILPTAPMLFCKNVFKNRKTLCWQLYDPVAIILTNLENPRTQNDFDKGYAYKIYAMAFMNNYSVSFYLAFFKVRFIFLCSFFLLKIGFQGKFFTHPGDKQLWNTWFGLGVDLCDYPGCMTDLFITLLIILSLKGLAMTALQHIRP